MANGSELEGPGLRPQHRRQADRARAQRLNESLATGATALLHACEDCVQEIRFHRDALMKAVARKDRVSSRLQALISDAERHVRPPAPRPAAAPATMASAPPAQPQRRRGDAAPPLPAFDTAGQPAPPQPEAASAATMPDHACDAAAAAAPPPALQVYCFGQCRILQDGHPIEGWPQTKGKAIFKYLLLHRRHPVAKEVLMQTFWPDADPEGARNNLNVAIYGARKILARAQPAVTHILLQDGCYRLNPAVPTWTDVDRFLDCVMTGREQERLTQFEAARALYQEAEQLYREDLLVEDRLEEWLAPERMRLRDLMLDTLRRLVRINERAADLQACIATCRRLLEIDPCDEAVHRELMQFYCRRAQPHLALRQFQSCADALSRQLHMIPSPQTTALFRQIQRREAPGPALANGE